MKKGRSKKIDYGMVVNTFLKDLYRNLHDPLLTSSNLLLSDASTLEIGFRIDTAFFLSRKVLGNRVSLVFPDANQQSINWQIYSTTPPNINCTVDLFDPSDALVLEYNRYYSSINPKDICPDAFKLVERDKQTEIELGLHIREEDNNIFPYSKQYWVFYKDDVDKLVVHALRL